MNGSPSRSRDLLACLGDASRCRIVERLARGERCVTELARDVALSQSCTTRHLQALRRAGLVSGTRAGRRILFRLRLDDPAVDGLLRWMLSETRDESGSIERASAVHGGKGWNAVTSASPVKSAGRARAPTRSAPHLPAATAGSVSERPAMTGPGGAEDVPPGSGASGVADPVRPDRTERDAEDTFRRPVRSEIEDFLL